MYGLSNFNAPVVVYLESDFLNLSANKLRSQSVANSQNHCLPFVGTEVLRSSKMEAYKQLRETRVSIKKFDRGKLNVPYDIEPR